MVVLIELVEGLGDTATNALAETASDQPQTKNLSLADLEKQHEEEVQEKKFLKYTRA